MQVFFIAKLFETIYFKRLPHIIKFWFHIY